MKKIKIIIENKEKPSDKYYYFYTIYLSVSNPPFDAYKEYSGSTAGVARIVLEETYAFDPDTNNKNKQPIYQAYLMPSEPGKVDKSMKNCGGWIKHPGNGRRYTKYEAIEDALTSCRAYVDDEGVEKPTRPGEPGTLGSVTMRNRSRKWAKQPHHPGRPNWAVEFFKILQKSKKE